MSIPLSEHVAERGAFSESDFEALSALLAQVESNDVLADDSDGVAIRPLGPLAVSSLTTLSITQQLSTRQFPAWLAAQKTTREIMRLILHHTQTLSSTWKGEESIRDCWNWHVLERGWRHIGYHFIIAPDGSIWVCRPLNWTGAHAGPTGNPMSIGVSLWADLTQEEPTEAALEALGIVWASATDFFGMRPEVFFHRDFMQTDCPGNIEKGDVSYYAADAEMQLGKGSAERRLHNGKCGVSVKGRVYADAGWCQDGICWLPASLVSGLGYQVQWDGKRKLGVIYNDNRVFHSIPAVPALAGRPQCFAVNSYIPCFISSENKLYVAARPLAQALGVQVGWENNTLTLG